MDEIPTLEIGLADPASPTNLLPIPPGGVLTPDSAGFLTFRARLTHVEALQSVILRTGSEKRESSTFLVQTLAPTAFLTVSLQTKDFPDGSPIHVHVIARDLFGSEVEVYLEFVLAK